MSSEYIVTVYDSSVWDTGFWDEMTEDGLGSNFVPTRAINIVNERPFNEFSAHFELTNEEADVLRRDPRVQSVELPGRLTPRAAQGFLEIRPTERYDKSTTIATNMKNWGLLRCNSAADPFGINTSINAQFPYNLDGTGVDIIVVDSGVEPGHPEFAVNADGTGGTRVVDFDWYTLGVPGVPTGASIGGYLGDSDGHGSNCASIAAGNTCGWASGAAIYSIRIFAGNSIRTGAYLGAIDSDYAFDLVRAFHLEKIAQGNTRPTICTNSWGWRSSYSGIYQTVWRGTTYSTYSINSSLGQVYSVHPMRLNYVDASVENCAAVGVIMVGAAGNYRHKIDVPGGIDYNNYYFSTSSYGTPNYYHRGSSPTAAPSMINIGALDNTAVEQKVYFSESGPRVDLYAPGVMIMGAYANKPYVTSAVSDPRNSSYYLNKISGTSQATPQVTGMLACVLQARPTLTVDAAKAFVTGSSLKNVLYAPTTGGYTNPNSLQDGNNRLLYQLFNGSLRGLLQG